MGIRKREGSDAWYIDIRTPGGGRIRQTSGTTNRKEAQELHDKLKYDLWRVAKLGEQPRYTFDEAALRFLKESEGLPDATSRKIHLRHFRQFFGGRMLDSITRDEIFKALPEFNQRCKQERAVSRATKNRYLGTMRNLLNSAVKTWEWLDKAPQLAELSAPNRRVRRGKPVRKWWSEQWNRQCARAGIENFRFHDVRHTWASWHVQAGTPLPRLMELGGWSKYEHVLRYAHLAPDHLAEHAEAVTIWAQQETDSPQTLAA